MDSNLWDSIGVDGYFYEFLPEWKSVGVRNIPLGGICSGGGVFGITSTAGIKINVLRSSPERRASSRLFLSDGIPPPFEDFLEGRLFSVDSSTL